MRITLWSNCHFRQKAHIFFLSLQCHFLPVLCENSFKMNKVFVRNFESTFLLRVWNLAGILPRCDTGQMVILMFD